MGLNCGCPVGASIASVVNEVCSESFGQIQKIIFQRIFSSGTTKNGFTIATANPNVKASWTPMFAASDGTKAVISPYVENPTSEPGAAVKFGGGNATINGIERIIGKDPSKFSGMLYSVRQATTIKALKTLECENLGVYLVDEYGRIGGIGDAATPTTFRPIPIHSLFVGDKKLGGRTEPDSNSIEFAMSPNWSDNLHIVTPTDFNPLTDL